MRVSFPAGVGCIAFAVALSGCGSHGTPMIPANADVSRPHRSHASAVPSYCSGFAAATGNKNSAPQKVKFVDKNAALGANLYLYLVTGYDNGAGGHQYLTAGGTLATFQNGVSAPAIPLKCFPGSIGTDGTGLTFALPPPTTANTSGNLYLVYATPPPGGGIPNPLPFKGVGPGAYSAPATDWNSAAFVDLPYDYIEYTLPNGITDVTQVNKVGLPLRVQQGTADLGFASGAAYKSLLDSILAKKPYWNKLAFSAIVNKHKVLGGILATQNGGVWGFPQDYFYNGKYATSGKNNANGYLGYVMNQYKANPRAYTTKYLTDVPTQIYCASSDGTANILFYAVSAASDCKKALKNPKYTMPIVNSLKGTGVLDSNICQSAIFAMPYGGPNAIFPDLTSFYLWKAMVIDFNRGVILATSTHPIGTWQTDIPAGQRTPFSDFYTEDQESQYSHFVHKYMIDHLSYALAYDEPGGYGPTFTSQPSQTMKVTIQEIPAYSAPVPTVLPTPLPCPSS